MEIDKEDKERIKFITDVVTRININKKKEMEKQQKLDKEWKQYQRFMNGEWTESEISEIDKIFDNVFL